MLLKRRDKNHYVRSDARRSDEMPSGRMGRTIKRDAHRWYKMFSSGIRNISIRRYIAQW